MHGGTQLIRVEFVFQNLHSLKIQPFIDHNQDLTYTHTHIKTSYVKVAYNLEDTYIWPVLLRMATGTPRNPNSLKNALQK